MNRTFKGINLLLIIYFLSCSPSSLRKSPSLKIPTLSDWPILYQENFKTIKSMKSKAMITLESPNFAASFTADMIYTAPDTLFMQAEGPLGIDLGKIFIGKNRFIIYNQFNNQFLSGSLDNEYYNTFLETHLTLRQIKTAFIGKTPIPTDLNLVDANHGIFATLNQNDKWRYTVNIESGLLEKWEIIKNNQLIFTQEYKSYNVIDGVVIPRLIRVILPQKQEMIAIYHKNIQINQHIDKSSYAIEIRPKTKQLIIGE